MTESPFVKAEGPEPPDVVDFLGKEHQEARAKVNATILEQLQKQPAVLIPENKATVFIEDWGPRYTADPRSIYSKEPVQPDRTEIERVRAAVYRTEMALTRTRNNLARATEELNRLTQVVRQNEAKLLDNYQLIGQLVGYLDSIEWGTHDEWTRSQSLRERAHEYLTGNTIAT